MILSEKFEHFTMEWDFDNPDNLLVDAYDVSYDIDLKKLINFISEIKQLKDSHAAKLV